ncbi:hypothetical protein MJO28_014952 [Puccinia striiformis f. sp. tritici]|uniref:Uncharacterized protein n=1 Tax=Puccinia striiformis f. sp. tritici TaxID=168172 RepID=A0ACC0DRC3_9BASI|nr:hypothetical protein MJO28_014952 [Puccinia striiformis f. sp. tritici]
MENSLRVKWDSKPKKLVGLRLDYKDNSIYLSQQLLLDQTVKKFKSKVNQTIIPTYTPLAGDNLVTSWGDLVSPPLYQSLIGSINYLALGTCPDLTFASLEIAVDLSIKCDNRAAVLVSDDNTSKGRMKSLERNFFFVNDACGV